MECLICENELVCEWTDLHGVGRCTTCQCTYTILQYDESGKRIPDAEPIVSIKDEYISPLKEYWRETGRRMGLGNYLGWHPNPEDRDALHEWLDENFASEQI